MIAGFTGTHQGMSLHQMVRVLKLIDELELSEARHGDCIGADSQFHHLCLAVMRHPCIVIHPPSDDKSRAWEDQVGERGYVLEPKPYLERNHDIVDATPMLIATPVDTRPILRSGTWATMRYAAKQGKPVTVVWPNGKSEAWS
jgi:hypothetical protein